MKQHLSKVAVSTCCYAPLAAETETHKKLSRESKTVADEASSLIVTELNPFEKYDLRKKSYSIFAPFFLAKL